MSEELVTLAAYLVKEGWLQSNLFSPVEYGAEQQARGGGSPGISMDWVSLDEGRR
jgi:hypothetical protein